MMTRMGYRREGSAEGALRLEGLGGGGVGEGGEAGVGTLPLIPHAFFCPDDSEGRRALRSPTGDAGKTSSYLAQLFGQQRDLWDQNI